MPWWQAVDAWGFDLMGRITFPGDLPLMLALSALGSAAGVVAQGALVAAWLLRRGRKRGAAGLALALAGGWLLEMGLKEAVGRPRPLLPRLAYAAGYSFPSGHSLVAFVLYGYLALVIGREAPRRRWIQPFLFFLPLGVGASRVYLGVHYPTDVVAGWLLGGLWLGVWWRWWQKKVGPESSPPPARGVTGPPASLGLGLLGIALLVTVSAQGVEMASAAARCDLTLAPGVSLPPELVFTLRSLYEARARGLLSGDPAVVAPYYAAEEATGRWAREHDQTRIRHLSAWAAARGIEVSRVGTQVRVALAEITSPEAWLEMAVREEVEYRYRRPPRVTHVFGVGAWHVTHLARQGGRWEVVRDWFSDPLEEAPLVAEGDAPGNPLLRERKPSPEGPAGESVSPRRYNREAAVAYADRYCGPAAGLDSHYNPRYRDYSCLGGDCANFVSQVLSDPEGGGLATDWTWRYAGEKGTRAWTRAEDLVFYLLDSGRATLRGRGRYADLNDPAGGAVRSLEPGDIIGYEQGESIRHVSVLVGFDAAGYPLVNSHTGDRYRVPWDLGWDASTVFWLLHIIG